MYHKAYIRKNPISTIRRRTGNRKRRRTQKVISVNNNKTNDNPNDFPNSLNVDHGIWRQLDNCQASTINCINSIWFFQVILNTRAVVGIFLYLGIYINLKLYNWNLVNRIKRTCKDRSSVLQYTKVDYSKAT